MFPRNFAASTSRYQSHKFLRSFPLDLKKKSWIFFSIRINDIHMINYLLQICEKVSVLCTRQWHCLDQMGRKALLPTIIFSQQMHVSLSEKKISSKLRLHLPSFRDSVIAFVSGQGLKRPFDQTGPSMMWSWFLNLLTFGAENVLLIEDWRETVGLQAECSYSHTCCSDGGVNILYDRSPNLTCRYFFFLLRGSVW